VKVSAWCAVSASRIVGSVYFNEKINRERHVQVIFRQFFPELTEKERLYGWFQQDSATAHTACICMQALYDFFGDRIIIGQHIHPILITVISSSGVAGRTKFTTVTPEQNY
jgi:hypothetical protein